MKSLSDFITEEQLVDLCLTLVSATGNSYKSLEGPVGNVLRAKAFQILGEDATEKEINNKVEQMLLEKDYELLAKLGVVEVDLSGPKTQYKFTKKGLESVERLTQRSTTT